MATEKNITMKQFNGTDYDTLYPKTKLEQVEGAYTQQQILSDSTKGLYGLDSGAVPDDAFIALTNCFAQILVTTSPNTVVTASLNGKTVSATSDSSGLAILKIPGFGTWTVGATISGIPTFIDYKIKAIAQYELVLFPSLEIASWDYIDSTSKSGNAASIWSVGDKKTVNIDGANYQVQIIGFDHDTKTSGGKAGITFQLAKCLNSEYSMNSSRTNNGGWTKCKMRTSTLNSIFSSLPADLQSVIKDVDKLTSAGNGSSTINKTSDKLFLLSEVEVWGSTTNSFTGEGTQYAYYNAGNSKFKGASWWNRSPSTKESSECFCDFRDYGEGSPGYTQAQINLGVAFAFCV